MKTKKNESLTRLKAKKNNAVLLLQDLARLKAEGILTEQEFQAKKTEILNRL